MVHRMQRTLFAAVLLAIAAQSAEAAPDKAVDTRTVARGKYLVEIAGCNDCHTAGYAESGGKTPEKDWLTGDALGWRGPWGTTYATNLRMFMNNMSREQWLKHARSMQPRPPMPWFNVRKMTNQDLTAIHAYVRSLGPAGSPAPAYVPPNQTPSGPYVQFPQ
ncbi:MAG: cytochrome c [Casimicrobiaceae bacterium]